MLSLYNIFTKSPPIAKIYLILCMTATPLKFAWEFTETRPQGAIADKPRTACQKIFPQPALVHDLGRRRGGMRGLHGRQRDFNATAAALSGLDGRVGQLVALVRDAGGAMELRADEFVRYADDIGIVGGGRIGGRGQGRGVREEAPRDGESLARRHLQLALLEVEMRVPEEVGDGLPGDQALHVAGEKGLVLRLREADVDGRRGEHHVRVVRAADGSQALDPLDLEAGHGEPELEDRGQGRVCGAARPLLRLERGRLGVWVRARGRPEAEDEGGFRGDEGGGAVSIARLELGEVERMRGSGHE